jgi:hypothetical protein
MDRADVFNHNAQQKIRANPMPYIIFILYNFIVGDRDLNSTFVQSHLS